MGFGKKPHTVSKPQMMSTIGRNAGTFYTHGHYHYDATATTITQASATQVFGSANAPTAVHASIIASGAGTASGGAGVVEIEVTGTSITELGVMTEGDSQVIVADITGMATDQYFETPKKWLGIITFTIKNASGGTHTAFSSTFNYGFCKYTDLSDSNFTVKQVKVEGLANANDTGFNIRLLRHSSTGWTYAATNFVPGNGQIVSLIDDYGANNDLVNGEEFAWDRVGINEYILGAIDEGYIVEITTGANNSIQYLTTSVGVLF